MGTHAALVDRLEKLACRRLSHTDIHPQRREILGVCRSYQRRVTLCAADGVGEFAEEVVCSPSSEVRVVGHSVGKQIDIDWGLHLARESDHGERSEQDRGKIVPWLIESQQRAGWSAGVEVGASGLGQDGPSPEAGSKGMRVARLREL